MGNWTSRLKDDPFQAEVDWIVEVSLSEKDHGVSPQDVKPSNSPRTLMDWDAY
jgi:hypothetical protein